MVSVEEALSTLRSCRLRTLAVSYLDYMKEDDGSAGSLAELATRGSKHQGSFSCNPQPLSTHGSGNRLEDRDRQPCYRASPLFPLIQLPIFRHLLPKLLASMVCRLLSHPSIVQRSLIERRNRQATYPLYAGQ